MTVGDKCVSEHWIDVFISKRDSVSAVAQQLKDALEERGLQIGWQHSLGKEGGVSHIKRARGQINRASTFVVLIDTDIWFDPAPGGGVASYQLEEIEAALKKEEQNRRNAFRVFAGYVLSDAVPDHETLERVTPRYLEEDMSHVDFVLLERDAVFGRPEDINALADMIADHACEHSQDAIRGAGPPAQNTKVTKGNVGLDPNFDYLAYLDRHSHDWLRNKFAKPKSPFGFSPERFIPLQATPSQAALSELRLTAGEAIVAKRDKPLYIFGPAGAGKSTTVYAVASALAATVPGFDPPMNRYLKQINEKLSPAVRKSDLRPILLSADVLSEVSHSLDSAGGVERFFERIAKVAPELTDLRSALNEHRYLVIIDGVDEISNPDIAEAIEDDVEDVATYFYGDPDNPLNVVLTSRRRSIHYASFDVFDLSAPEGKQVDDFIKRYVEGSVEPTAQREVARAIRRNLEQLTAHKTKTEHHREQWRAIRRRPLLLNAFCWHVTNDNSLEHVRSDAHAFFSRVIDHLLSRQYGDEAEKSALVRSVLQRLSVENLQSDFEGRRVRGDLAVKCVIEEADAQGLKYSPEQAAVLLGDIRQHVGLLSAQKADGSWQVAPGFFCGYLAAERFATLEGLGGRRFDDLLTRLSRLKISVWLDAMHTAFVLRLRGGVVESTGDGHNVEWAYRIPNALLGRAEDASSSDERFDWLVALGEIFRDGVAQKAYECDDGDRLYRLTHRAMALYSNLSPRLNPKQRAAALNAMANLSYRSDTLNAVPRIANTALDGLLGRTTQWIEAPYPSECGGSLLIKDAPVLVFEYRAFVDAGVDTAFWDHAPGDLQKTIKGVDRIEKRPNARRPSDVWADIRNRLFMPMVYVTWYEAVAYCRWLTHRLRDNGEIGQSDVIRLLTPNEWLDLARYCAKQKGSPLGDAGAPGIGDDARVNYVLAKLSAPSSPGAFDAYGLDGLYDFGTNVSSWMIRSQPSATAIWPPKLNSDTLAPVLGGSWNSSLRELSIERPPRTPPAYRRQMTLGFRVALVKK